MKALILATASVIALGIGGAGTANAWSGGYSGSAMPPSAQSYYPNYSGNTGHVIGTAYRPGGWVVRTQLALRRDGFYHGNIDGIFGPETSEALEDYQGQHGLPVTGSLNPETIASLFGTTPGYEGTGAPPAGYQSRYPGLVHLTHGQIAQAQMALRRDGLYHGDINGLLGPATREALGDFQRRNGLRITDNLDRATMASLLGNGAVGVGTTMPPQMQRPMATGQAQPPQTGTNNITNDVRAGQTQPPIEVMPPQTGTSTQGTETGAGAPNSATPGTTTTTTTTTR